MGSEAVQEPVNAPKKAAASTEKKSKQTAARKLKPAQRPKKKLAKTKKTEKAHTPPPRPAPKAKVRRKHSTEAERAKILAAADREGLTALQVQKRFGVKPVTYYSWRKTGKKVGTASARTLDAVLAGLNIAGQLQLAVRAQIQQLLPRVVERELASVLAGVGAKRRGRPRRGL